MYNATFGWAELKTASATYNTNGKKMIEAVSFKQRLKWPYGFCLVLFSSFERAAGLSAKEQFTKTSFYGQKMYFKRFF